MKKKLRRDAFLFWVAILVGYLAHHKQYPAEAGFIYQPI
jgi:hypothetical protein